MKTIGKLGLVLVLLSAPLALAQGTIPIGVTLSATGPAASLGIPERNTFLMLEQMINEAGGIGGYEVHFEILDDASDTTQAVRNTRSLIEESEVVAVVGSTVTPNSLAMIDVVAAAEVPMISMAASKAIIAPVDEQRFWVFKTPQTDELMATAVVRDMVEQGVQTAAYIGFNDAYGEGWWNDFSRIAGENGIEIVANERYAREDTSVTGQALRIISQRPDAVLVGASGTPAVLPQRTLVERGYQGDIYQTHGIANPDFLRVGGEDVEGTRFPVGPILVAQQLPDGYPSKEVGLEYIELYESEFGEGSYSTFGAHAYDAWLILEGALTRALGQSSPENLSEFRSILRDEIEATQDLVATHGVFTYTPEDHLGLSFDTSSVMVTVEEGDWQLLYTFLDTE